MESLFGLIVNFKHVEGATWLLPQLLICTLDKTGQPSYLKAAAWEDNIASYGFDPAEPHIATLVRECEDLTPEAIEAFFNRGKKKRTPLISLFENTTLKKHIQDYIDRKIHKVILCMSDHNIPSTFQLKRKEHIAGFILNPTLQEADPILSFTKTPMGVQYSLRIRMGDKTIYPSHQDIHIVTHQHGWLILDRTWVCIKNISAQKLLPFLQKETLYIPDKTVRTYFEKFVLDLMSQVDIETEGFDVISQNEADSQSLFFIYDFMRHKWVADIRFHYGKETFMWSSPIRRKSRLFLDVQGNLTVVETTRNKVYEQNKLQELYKAGFEENLENYLQAGEGLYDSLEAVARYERPLKKVFHIQNPHIDGKDIFLHTFNSQTVFHQKSDWFDLTGQVTIGDETHAFSKLLKYIKKGDPFFRLNDGSYTLIPQEFFHTYDKVARFSEEYHEGVRLRKVHYPLLENIQVPEKNKDQIQEYEDIFTPSPFLKASLRPYQVKGVQWLIDHRKNGLGACLADDMGLGKTLQTIAALLDAREHKEDSADITRPIQLDLFGETIVTGRKSLSALIILPASLVYNWYHELKKYCPAMQILRYTGAKRHSALRTMLEFDFILTTYQTVITDADLLKDKNFHYIVLDESHYIKNKDSKSFQVINQLNGDHKISLTGTPVENSLSDLWSQMEFINPAILGSYTFFKKHFKDPIEKNQSDASLQELRTLIAPYILRRVKSEVAKDLPDLIETTQYCDMTPAQKVTYDKEKSAARNYLAGLDKKDSSYTFHVFSALMKLRQMAIHPWLADDTFDGESGKHEDLLAETETIIKSGQKVLIFSSFKSYLTMVAGWLDKNAYPHGVITGSVTAENRQKAVEAFQNDPRCQVLLISLKAGGTGLNLTAADYVFIVEPWWNPFAEMQAIARAHRIGRQQNVVVKRFISRDTIDEKIIMLQTRKKTMAEDVLDVEWTPSLSEEDIHNLLQ